MADWRWWVFSDGGQAARVAIGVAILATLALTDLHRNGRSARRWREYGFLVVSAVAAAAYGAINDLLTSAISWEYFYYGKGLAESLGPRLPPDRIALAYGAMKIGIDSSWSAGVLSAAILLTANSYRRTAVTPMPMRRLARWLVFIIFGAFFGGLIGGILGHACLLNGVSKDFGDLGEFGISQPARFMTTWGIHAGSYFGAAAFTVIAASLIRYGNSSAIMLPDVGTPNGD